MIAFPMISAPRRLWPSVAVAALVLLAGCQSGGMGDPGDSAVNIPPYVPSAGTSPLSAVSSKQIAVVVHERGLGTGALPGRIGERQTLGNISMGFVTIEPAPAQLIADALTAELRHAGHIVAATAPARLDAQVQSFHMRTDVTALYWDVVMEATVGMTLSASGHNAAATYGATCTDRTYVWPTNALMASVVSKCVAEITHKFRDDPDMARALAGG